MAQPSPSRRLTIWDLPTRAFHWLIVVLVTASWATAELDRLDWHMWTGYGALTLILFRIIWGIVGSEPSRFAAFVRGPGAVARYAGELLRGRPPKTAGHNPLGALVIVVMLGLLLFVAATGLFADDGIFTRGPLAKLVDGETSKLLTGWHLTGFDILTVLIFVHVAAALLYQFAFKQRLIGAMVTGRKDLPAGTPAPRLVSPFWAIPAALAAAGIVWYVVTKV